MLILRMSVVKEGYESIDSHTLDERGDESVVARDDLSVGYGRM